MSARYPDTAITPLAAHACNCIGCCPRCGSCRTSPQHTADFCALLQRQASERAAHVRQSVAPAAPLKSGLGR